MNIFEYKRGNDWSVLCVIRNDLSISFINLKQPINASTELSEKFIDEAEKAVLKELEKGHAN